MSSILSIYNTSTANGQGVDQTIFNFMNSFGNCHSRKVILRWLSFTPLGLAACKAIQLLMATLFAMLNTYANSLPGFHCKQDHVISRHCFKERCMQLSRAHV
jgi:hypothetical protein